MNQTHEDRLEALAEKLADVFLDEADPAKWNGDGAAPRDRSKEQRGDRQWDLKNANQLGLLFARALELRARVRWVRQSAEGGTEPPPPGGNLGEVPVDPDAEIKRFEGEASKVLERVAGRRGK